MRWGKRVKEPPPEPVKIVPQYTRPTYEGAFSTKPGLEEIFEETRRLYGYAHGGGGGSGRISSQQGFVKKADDFQKRINDFEQWAEYQAPKKYPQEYPTAIDITIPERMVPVEPDPPKGKTLDELFAEDIEAEDEDD